MEGHLPLDLGTFFRHLDYHFHPVAHKHLLVLKGCHNQDGRLCGHRGHRRSSSSRTPSRTPIPELGPSPGLTFDEELRETLLISDRDFIRSVIRHRALVDGENSLLSNILKHVPGAKIPPQSRHGADASSEVDPSASSQASHSRPDRNCAGGQRRPNF